MKPRAQTGAMHAEWRLVLGTADGWLKADGEPIYAATDLRVGLSTQSA